MLLQACRIEVRRTLTGRHAWCWAQRVLLAIVIGLSLTSCARDDVEGAVEPLQQRLVYGEDDRVEGLDTELSAALVAMLPRTTASYVVDAGTGSFETVHGLCPGARFASQPAVAECTGVFITDDLIVTAAHCLDRVDSCRDYVFVRNYAMNGDAGLLANEWITLECDEAILVVNTSVLDAHNLDFAVLRVVESATNLVPPALRRSAPRVGEAVITVGTSGGLPVKATSGTVLSTRAEGDYFDFTGDLFRGGSGSGVFDANGSLLGIHVRGSPDFEYSPEGCRRIRNVPEDGSESEQANTLDSILDALCGQEPQLAPCREASEPEPADGEKPEAPSPRDSESEVIGQMPLFPPSAEAIDPPQRPPAQATPLDADRTADASGATNVAGVTPITGGSSCSFPMVEETYGRTALLLAALGTVQLLRRHRRV